MSNPDRKIDKTHLSLENAEDRGFIHRDYIAHCLRWSHVIKFLQGKQRYKQANILDVGCGKEVPLARTLYSSRLIVNNYCGIDVNKLSVPDMFHTGKFPIELFSGDVCELNTDDIGYEPNVITCFEVLEHVAPEHSRRMLSHLHNLASEEEETRVFVSTPVWDPHVGAASNHINEIKFNALGAAIEDSNFQIEGVYGTFASIKDYRDRVDDVPGLRYIFDTLRAYYDVNYLATVFAPMFPENSRNCLWELKPLKNKHRTKMRQFPAMRDLLKDDEPWTSSPDWKEFGHV